MKRSDQGAILAELKRLYPEAKPELHFSNPYETLVATILSAQCTDKQVNKVTPALFEKYPSVKELAEAKVEDVFQIVKSCGFKSKATNLVAASAMIMAKHGGKVPATMKELTMLPGVGQKTANVVLANAFHIPTIAVDTHVFRVSNRLGLADAKNVELTEKQLQKVVPREDWIEAHHWLIFHGRRVCHARGPACESCTLREICRAMKGTRSTGKIEPARKKTSETNRKGKE